MLIFLFLRKRKFQIMGRAFEYRKSCKMARWDKTAKTFSKIGQDIAIAVKLAVQDPDSNPALRRCIQNAKGQTCLKIM